MGPHRDSLWLRWLFPLHFFDDVRIGFLNQIPQPDQHVASPIARYLNDVIYLLSSSLAFHAGLSPLRFRQSVIVVLVREDYQLHHSAQADGADQPATIAARDFLASWRVGVDSAGRLRSGSEG